MIVMVDFVDQKIGQYDTMVPKIDINKNEVSRVNRKLLYKTCPSVCMRNAYVII